MKRHGHLWDRLVSYDNLLEAAEKARRGKRFRPATLAFELRLESELWKLCEELAAKTYRPGPYHTFYVYEPKQRLISAAPYRDRVVHHALVKVLGPIFERRFVFDSYACRKGKGTHAAVDRCQKFARKHRYVLKADVKKFFPSMDHALLKELIARKVKDPDVLWLAGQIIDHSNPQEPVLEYFPGDDLVAPLERRRGIPIGNQTSQFFANVYLDPLDHFLKDRLGASGYVRYVDDFLVFSDDKAELHRIQEAAGELLAGLRLRLHPRKCAVFPVACGIRFLGYRVFPTHRLLVKDNVRRFRRRMKKLKERYAVGTVSPADVHQHIASWIAHASHASTYRLRVSLFRDLKFQRAAAEKPAVTRRRVHEPSVERALGQPQRQPADGPQQHDRSAAGEDSPARRQAPLGENPEAPSPRTPPPERAGAGSPGCRPVSGAGPSRLSGPAE